MIRPKLGSNPIFFYLLATFCSLTLSSQLVAAPPINWDPKGLSIEQSQVTLSLTEVTFEVTSDTPRMTALVVPELAPWVSVSPSSFDELLAGQHVVVTVAINLPLSAPVGSFDGVVQLRSAADGQPQRVLAKPFPISLTVIEFDEGLLPPDPGEEGKQTLLGIDSDGDGVRDDIQRYIYFGYYDKPAAKLALTEVAKEYQVLLVQSGDKAAAFGSATKMARHGECLDYFEGEQASDILAAIKAEFLNTRERSIAFINYNENLGGQIILGRSLADWKNSCVFDVDAMGVAQ